MGRGGGLHTLSRREAAAADQAGPRGARRDLRDARLSLSTSRDRLVGAPQVPRRGCDGGGLPDRWGGNGRSKAAVLPDLRPSGSPGRGADARGQQHRGDRGCRRQGRGLAQAAAGSEDRHQLHRPGRAPLLFLNVAGAARPLLRQDCHPDRQCRSARSAQAAAQAENCRGSCAGGTAAGHPAGIRTVFTLSGGVSSDGAGSAGSARHR